MVIMKAAIRLLVSDEQPAIPSAEGLEKLKLKHSPASLCADTLPPPDPETNVWKVVMSFPAGSSGGPDGLRLQRLKDLINSNKVGSDLLTALIAFVDMVLAGRCPQSVEPGFFGDKKVTFVQSSRSHRHDAASPRSQLRLEENMYLIPIAGSWYSRRMRSSRPFSQALFADTSGGPSAGEIRFHQQI